VTDVKGYRDMRFSHRDDRSPQYSVVMPRVDLDILVAEHARKAGANLWQRTVVTGPRLENGRVCGVNVRQQERDCEVSATFVVAADGATSAFAGKADLFVADRWSLGYAVRGYFDRIEAIEDDSLFNIHVPLLDPRGDRMLAGYGWVFPMDSGRANIGVGFFPCQRQDFELNLRPVFDRFIDDLRRKDRRFRDMELVGRLRGAPLNCGVSPAHCAGRGVLLAGDAAGLVDPLTGEGIDSALESGKLAAEVLIEALTSPNPAEADLSAYCRLLESRFDDRFRRGRSLIRRYGFLGRMLESTFDIDHPLFESVRRAVIDYGTANRQVDDIREADLALLGDTGVAANVHKVRHELAAIVQSEFPVLARALADLEDSTASQLRIQLVFLAGAFGPGGTDGSAAATAIELAHLGHTVHGNILDDAATGRPATMAPSSTIRWGNMLTVMAGDYFLAKAYRIAAKLGTEFSQTVSRASTDVCLARMREAERAHNLDSLDAADAAEMKTQTAAFFQLAALLGARTSGASPDVAAQLANYGRNLGIAFALMREVHDVRASIGDPLKHPVVSLLERGVYSWPIVVALRDDHGGRLRGLLRQRPISADQICETLARLESTGATACTMTVARSFVNLAKSSLDHVPETSARGMLGTLADFVVDQVRDDGSPPARSSTVCPSHSAVGSASTR
jgi:flavin-dependent dehydrogenase/geranylgeranyl pyrophosphate synthase